MTIEANWSYTAKATIWRSSGTNEFNDPTFLAPEIFYCDYQGGVSGKVGDIGLTISDATTIWSEYANAAVGDYIMIGESAEASPPVAGAHKVMFVTRYADTFHRTADDYAIITGKG